METVLIGANSTKVENGPKRELPHLLATLNILYSQFQANGEDIDSQSGQVPIYSSKIEASYRKKDDFHTKTISKKCTGYHMKYPFNPHWQIMENSSRIFSKIFIFWVVHTGRFT